MEICDRLAQSHQGPTRRHTKLRRLNGERRKALGEHAFIDLYEHLLNRASAKVSAKDLQWSPFVKPLLRLAQPSARPLRITEDGHRLVEDAHESR
jgi:hypothetical protein